MRFTETRFARLISTVLAFSLLNMSVPYSAFGKFGDTSPTPPKTKTSRTLSAKDLKNMSGRLAENPFISGSQKWSPTYKGVDMLTGNFSMSCTDLTYEGGYGIPVNITRSYSANNPDEGPMGIGWSLSVDIRNTAGGLLKSSGAPNRSVPSDYHNRPSSQDDPSIPSTNEPVDAVVANDASGKEETIQVDVDGVLNTPAWDKNSTVTEYELVVVPASGGTPEKRYSIANKVTTATPDGTVYVYEKKGSYINGGAYAYNDSSGAKEPSNVLKITSVTDRHGNVTTYNYSTGSDTVQFDKYNGLTEEFKLTSIEMPGDRSIHFYWGSGSLADRITSARAYLGSSSYREVLYGYDSSSPHSLTSFTTPEGRETTFAYGSTDTVSGGTQTGTDLLNSITDPRGMTTSIHYVVGDMYPVPYGTLADGEPCVFTYKIILPNGNTTRFWAAGVSLPTGETPSWIGSGIDEGVAFGDFPTTTDLDSSHMSNQGTVFYAAGLNYSHPELSTIAVHMDRYASLGVSSNDGTVIRTYNLNSQDLLEDITGWNDAQYEDLSGTRHFAAYSSGGSQSLKTTTTYNFLGNPLTKTVQPYTGLTGGTVMESDYAYWGANRYYQQKAIRTKTGSSSWRYGYTDYYDSSSSDGLKGQVYRVYDSKYGALGFSGSDWRAVAPGTGNNYSAQFNYDSVGRPTQVDKLKTAGSSPVYITTTTSYGQLGSSATGGNATEVIEDAGSGKINRTTQNMEFDIAGRALSVHDATGKYWVTTYNDDGQVTDLGFYTGSGSWGVTQYTYGTSGITNGMVTSVLDQLSNVTETLTYESSSSNAGYGQVKQVHEDINGDYTYDVYYTFNGFGERDKVTYDTPNDITKWEYSDYIRVGPNPTGAKRVFQTLNRLHQVSGSWVPSDEEFHYQYDTSGRLIEAAFAQKPRSGQSTYQADSRARSEYYFDPLGHMTAVEYWWDTWNSTSNAYNAPVAIVKNQCDFDAYKGLKNWSKFFTYGSPNTAFNSSQYRTEQFAYDSDLDYLTGATYTTSGSTPGTDWTYDPSGNRYNGSGSGYTYDNLNRMTASPKSGGSYAYANDIMGNRTWRDQSINGATSARYTWDELGRMFSYCTTSGGAKYVYRSDGMRVKKIQGLSLSWVPNEDSDDVTSSGYYDAIWATNKPTTRYYYDGQMACEEDYQDDSSSNMTKYGLGARGIDYMEYSDGSTSTVGFPLYDCHGNMIGTLGRSGTNSFTTGDERYYDAWGIKNGGAASATGMPKQRYCARLGHVQDDESSLIYMRARYYEPTVGRFVSEDGSHDGYNWYSYCGSNPIAGADPSGNALLLDDLISDMIGLVNEIKDGLASNSAGNFMKQKLGDVFAYETGRLVGMLCAMEMDDLGTSFNLTGSGYAYGMGKGSGVHWDFDTSHHGYAHIDLDGKLKQFQNWYTRSFGQSRIPMDKFMDGFIDGFF